MAAPGAHHILSASSFMPDAPNVSEQSSFRLGNFSIDEHKPLKVAVIGAGFSGIVAGIRFRQRVPNVELTIYEQNAGVGGTWYSNKYPGLACDIPSHCYQYTFEEKTDWSAFYAPGPEIRSYLEGVVDKYKLLPLIKLHHELIHARYDEPTGKWHIRIRRPVSFTSSPIHFSTGESQTQNNAIPQTTGDVQYEEFEDAVDLLFTGVGGLSRWAWPDIEGLKDFKGMLLHSAQWDVEGETWQDGVKDWGEKRIGVIGVGSSAIQVVPALQPRVAKLYNYVRGKTWLSPPFAGVKLAELLKLEPLTGNYVFSEADKESFKDPGYYKKFRHELESDLNSVHLSTIRGSVMQQQARAAFKENMIKRLEEKPWIADHMIPDFGVACRRLTPGPGYLETLCKDNVEFITTHIKRITPGGIETLDGNHQDIDVLICATGYDTSFRFPFPMIGRNGIDIRDKWSPHPVTYLALCVDGFPNWFFSLGPNSGVGSGSLLAIIEQQVDYAVEVAKKMQRERLKSVEVKPEAVADFDEYLENYFPTSVYSEKCRSWYKMGKEEGRVVGLWPGSCLHALRAMKYPRWEDYSYERQDTMKNRFHWLGDGSTYDEKQMTGDRAWYLNDEYVDIPEVPEMGPYSS